MKFSTALLTMAATAMTAAAFTVGPQVVARPTPAFAASTSLKMSEALEAQKTFAQAEIDANDVVVFSKSYCPYCTATKELFAGMNVDITVHELDKMGDDGPALQYALLDMTGQKSVPNVFVKGQHMGGNDDTQAAAKDGKLKEILGL